MTSSATLCRTCLKEEGAFPVTYTTKGYEDIDFSVMLKLCTSISIEPEDSLPHLICEKCVATLVIAYTFKQQCERADLFLRSLVSVDDIKHVSLEIRSEHNENIKGEDSFIHVNKCLKSPTDFDIKKEEDISDNETIHEDTGEKWLVVCEKNEDIKNDKSIMQYNSDENESLIHNGRKLKNYKCLRCDKQFTTRYGFQYHIKQHTGTKNYICPIEKCKRKFFWEPALKRHMQTHSDEKKYLCYLCGKGYNAADSLRYHIINHKGERPHLCTQCGKTFKQHIHLKYHMSSHNDERTHVCSKCNRSYLGLTQLRKHWKNYCGIGKDPPPKRKTTHFKDIS